jgi:ion channel-forming bestrophin family protein
MDEHNKNLRLTVTDFASSTSSNNPNTLPSPGRVTNFKPLALRQPTRNSMDIEDLFVGPRDMNHHSKWPFFLRLHGSVLPKMILPLTFVALWATLFTCISKFFHELVFDSVLLTITGFVVGLALSFRSSTAYERYTEGRKYWAQLMVTGRTLARIIWVHTKERSNQGEAQTRADVLAKLTALNLINAFAVSLKHRLRFEPAIDYPDLQPLVGNLHTLAGEADQGKLLPKKRGSWKSTGEYLGVTFAHSNPRKVIKQSRENLGNLPLEVLNYLGAYLEEICANGQLTLPVHQTNSMNSIVQLADILTGCERVLNTPVPIAYSISISQITWVYILVLPFQLYSKLGWVTIFGTLLAAYIILGLAAIGYEIENPFGDDVNDLPLDAFCRELASDIDVLTSMPAATTADFVSVAENKVLYPLSMSGHDMWNDRSLSEIRGALRAKATTAATSVDFERAKALSESTNDTLNEQLAAAAQEESAEKKHNAAATVTGAEAC